MIVREDAQTLRDRLDAWIMAGGDPGDAAEVANVLVRAGCVPDVATGLHKQGFSVVPADGDWYALRDRSGRPVLRFRVQEAIASDEAKTRIA